MLQLIFKPLTLEDARDITGWQYEEPYTLYSFSNSDEEIFELTSGDYFSAVDDERGTVGYLCYGGAACVPGGLDAGIYDDKEYLDIGLGLKPSLTGKRFGLPFLIQSLKFLEKQCGTSKFQLVVATFNQRAIRVYEQAGFRRQQEFVSGTNQGAIGFIHMRLDTEGIIQTKNNRIDKVHRAVRDMSNEGFLGQEDVWLQLAGVSNFASLLAARRGKDRELAAITGLLHGCYLYRTGMKDFSGPNSADSARQLLRELQLFSQEELCIILQSIFYQEQYEQIHGPYEEILKDAVLIQKVSSPGEALVNRTEKDRLHHVMQELGMTHEDYAADSEADNEDLQDDSEGRRTLLADYAEKLAKQEIIGIPEDERFREICKYWPDTDIYAVLKANWCAAFVYHCCMQVGIKLPIRYPNHTYRLAGVGAWLDWSRSSETGFFHNDREGGFKPGRGDLVIYEKLLSDDSHDHIGIVLSCEDDYLLVAEGNVDNQNYSGIINRSRERCILGYIRISDDYRFHFQGEYSPF
ncbi:GNAT family N-acetyltransferase [Paenibacillus sp. FSL R7-0652]